MVCITTIPVLEERERERETLVLEDRKEQKEVDRA
jgi:hypothetical protein